MANMIDYVKWRGDISFNECSFNVVDALILSELSYVPFEDLVPSSVTSKGIPLSVLAEKYFSLHYDSNKLGAIIPTESILELFKLTALSRRFSDVKARGFINEIDIKAEKQFSAICFDIDKNSTVITFRGTDDTIIGWKEDLNMAFFTPIPAQKQAKDYLSSVISRGNKDTYYVCGHSKGGNLAAYSALKIDKKQQSKIEAVYNFDGPGFRTSFLEAENNNPIVPRLHKICPYGAIIGAIFDSMEEMKYVKSNAKGLYQHDAFSWEVLGKDFLYAAHPTKSSIDFHDTLNNWVSVLTDKERVEFVEALYTFLTANDTETLTDIVSNKKGFLKGVLKTDEKTKKTFFNLLNKLVKERYFKKDTTKKDKSDN